MMAKEPRSERWPYEPGAVARQPEFRRSHPPQPVLTFPDLGLTEIVRSARTGLRAAAVAIAVDTGDGMVCRARSGESAPDLGAPVDRNRGVTGECVCTGAVVRCLDTRNDPRVNPAFSERSGIRSILAAPLLDHEVVVGAIVAFFGAADSFTDDSVRRLEEFAREAVAQVFGPQLSSSPASLQEPAAAAPASEAPPPDVVEPPSLQPTTTDEAAFPIEELPSEPLPPGRRFHRSVPWIAYVAVAISAVTLSLLFTRGAKQPRESRPPAVTTSGDALEKTRTAAQAGDLAAEYTLANAYRDGAGVAADQAEARKWLRRAAEGGHPDAQLELAALLEHGPRARRVEAYTWYVIAWQAGKTEAESAIQRLTPRLSAADIARVRYSVGKAYASGAALPHDAISAYVWYALADRAGNTKARDRLRELEPQLTPQQLAEAKSRIAIWTRNTGSLAPPE